MIDGHCTDWPTLEAVDSNVQTNFTVEGLVLVLSEMSTDGFKNCRIFNEIDFLFKNFLIQYTMKATFAGSIVIMFKSFNVFSKVI